MISIPNKNDSDKFYFLEIMFFFILTVVFLASLVVLSYWYVFGDVNPFKQAEDREKIEEQIGKPYTYPKYQLKNVMKDKLFSQ